MRNIFKHLEAQIYFYMNNLRLDKLINMLDEDFQKTRVILFEVVCVNSIVYDMSSHTFSIRGGNE